MSMFPSSDKLDLPSPNLGHFNHPFPVTLRTLLSPTYLKNQQVSMSAKSWSEYDYRRNPSPKQRFEVTGTDETSYLSTALHLQIRA